MTKDKERDDAMIAEAAEVFPPDTVDVQSRYVIVHQLRASADIQDAQTKRETGWADTSDRACLMRKAADTLDALLHKLQPAPKPDRAEVLAKEYYSNTELARAGRFSAGELAIYIRRHFAELRAEWEAERLEIPPHKHYSTPLIERLNGPHEWGYRDPVEGGFIADMSPFEASDRLSELEAERPAVVVPFGDDVIAAARFYADVPVAESRIVIMANAILDGAKGGE